MKGKGATLSYLAVNELDCLTKNMHEQLSAEIISRISNIIDAYILFDEIYISPKYIDNSMINELDPSREIFKFFDTSKLMHADNLGDEITFDINLAVDILPRIMDDDKYWTIQHNPKMFSDNYDSIAARQHKLNRNSISYSHLRLWQWSAINEASSTYNATALFPNSVAQISKFDKPRTPNEDFIYKCLQAYTNEIESNVIAMSHICNDGCFETVKNFPALTACLLDRSNNTANILHTLKIMRNEYRELRQLRNNYTNEINNSKTIGEKKDVIRDWNSSWDKLLKTDFKRVGFIKRMINSSNIIDCSIDLSTIFSNISTGNINVSDFKDIAKLLMRTYKEHSDAKKITKRFSIFCDLNDNFNSITLNEERLFKKYNISIHK